MIRLVVVSCILAIASSGVIDPKYTIYDNGPNGMHVQMGEPGKAVSGYYTSRSLDGQMEYRTSYEADEKGYRATGDHLPVSSPVAAATRSGESGSAYVFNYNLPGHSHYQMGEPGKAVRGSFMFYDAEGRARRVDYEADEKGYRVLPAVDEAKPVAISSEADVVKADDKPAVEVAPEPVADLEVASQPIAAPEVVPAVATVVKEPVAETIVKDEAAVSAPEVSVADLIAPTLTHLVEDGSIKLGPLVPEVAEPDVKDEAAVVPATVNIADILAPTWSQVAGSVAAEPVPSVVVDSPKLEETKTVAVAEVAAEPVPVSVVAPASVEGTVAVAEVAAEPVPVAAAVVDPVPVVEPAAAEAKSLNPTEIEAREDKEPSQVYNVHPRFFVVSLPVAQRPYYRSSVPVYSTFPHSYSVSYPYASGNYLFAL